METEHDEAFDAVAAVREVVLRAYPEVVPERVSGESVAALLASGEPAAAYQRVMAGVAARRADAAGTGAMADGAPPVAPVAPIVPAGSAAAVALDVAGLPPVEKIRRALEARG